MPIQLDPFQEKAISYVEQEHSVLVSAPTGAGKTLIAESAIERALSRNEAVIYTAPVKALSNQKYRNFRAQYGDERVGILTGDVSINPDAPILIMTTEIYRNSLFENLERIRKVGWVIFDEVHYLDDPERGTVWEEALLFTPAEIRILALSATAPNIEELDQWIRSIHDRPIAIVKETHRPVPLEFLFQCQGKILENPNQLRREGYFNRDSWRLSSRERRRGFRPLRAKPNRLDTLLRHLLEKKRLPAIYFIFGRRRAEFLASEACQFDLVTGEERKAITELYENLLRRYDLTHEASADDLRPLVERGIAYHHAGMLPTLKEVVEQLFTSRLVKLIFTTETFALGINMPARSVVFDELEKFYGTRFRNLTTRDFYQMAGRAGRRGMDERGFVYVRIHPNDISFPEVQQILYGKTEPIRSQFNAAYATLLNLYREFGRGLTEIYPRSFHYYQSSRKRREEGLGAIERKLALLEEMGCLTPQGLTPKGEFAASLFGYELLLAEMQADGVLEELDEFRLSVLLSGLIFEPRKGDHPPSLSHDHERLLKAALHYAGQIHRRETKYRVSPYTKLPHFHLAPAVEAWAHGASFDKLSKLTTADEGELVRYFRMVIQLLRELLHAPHASERLRATAERARALINRDIVDAERQLRI
jgi:superfamily II RNA helicase